MFTNPVINSIMEKEGHYVDHPHDMGGPTCWGITEQVARKHGYMGDMKALSKEKAYLILEDDYWRKPGFDKVHDVAPILALELCDTGTNTGPALPIKWLQRWLNAYNNQQKYYADIAVDGVLGKKSLSALTSFLKKRAPHGENALITSLNCSQGNYHLELVEKREKNEAFIYGWITTRVALI